MATMDQVAKIANVSVATVSRVINNIGPVNAKTRKRVEDAIKRLQYEPNLLGRSLRRTKTNMILVLLHSIDNPFFANIIRGIEMVAHNFGYNVMICNTYGSKERENLYMDLMKQAFADGVILLSSLMNDDQLQTISEHYPIVQVIEYKPNVKVSAVAINYYQASCDLMEHLIRQGRKKIAFINTGLEPIVSTEEKYRAYVDTLKKYNLPIVTKNIIHSEFGYEYAKTVTEHLLDAHPDIDGIFTQSDLIACGAIDEIQRRKRNVPHDISIVGFDNIIYSRINEPRITTIDQNSYALGSYAGQLLLKKIQKEDVEEKLYILPHELLIRESS